MLPRSRVESSVAVQLQEARLAARIWAAATLLAALGCADPLFVRLFEPAPRPPARAPAPAGWVRYVTQPGDTLGAIASCRGVGVEELARVNRIPAPDRLVAGAALRVPPRDACAGARLPAAREAAPPGHGEARGHLELANSAYDAADFQQAIDQAQSCLRALSPDPEESPAPEESEGNAIRARCHLVSGMAAAGLEQRSRAVEEFRLALDLDPSLALDPEHTSPRVLELLERARERPPSGGRFVESAPP